MVLDTVKDCLLIDSNETAFDSQLIIYINSTLLKLFQLVDFVLITTVDETTSWSDVFSDTISETLADLGKTFICLSLKKVFDPPGSSFLLAALNETLKEIEQRLIYEEGKYE